MEGDLALDSEPGWIALVKATEVPLPDAVYDQVEGLAVRPPNPTSVAGLFSTRDWRLRRGVTG